MTSPRYPLLYQVNTRVWLNERARAGAPATLDAFDDRFLDQLAAVGFDWFWPLGVWQTGPAARAVSRQNAGWRQEYQVLLPDLQEADITGSPFAIQAYATHADFGGDAALARLRARLRRRDMRLLLDFVPNHTAPDHPWADAHPEYFIAGNEDDLRREPHNYLRLGSRILAHGRDPFFPGWPDTIQLNYRCPSLRRAMTDQLISIADRCDGVRCDMAMLLLPDIIQRTWGERSRPADGSAPVDTSFWLEAIPQVRAAHPAFLFMAEVYWDLEWVLQQQGFDYTYDKRLYDRLHLRDAEAVCGHLLADPDYQRRSVRFLENHDEPRAASAFPLEVYQAAAVIAFLVPGLRFLHEGQLEGRRRRVSMHLGRRPDEPADPAIQAFYNRLLPCLKLPICRDGNWRLLDCRAAWDGNHTWKRFIASTWTLGSERWLVAVNYGNTQGQCYVPLPWSDLRGRTWKLRDRLSDAGYDRGGDDLASKGLYLDVPPWCCHVFEVSE
jgi:glycosidase